VRNQRPREKFRSSMMGQKQTLADQLSPTVALPRTRAFDIVGLKYIYCLPFNMINKRWKSTAKK